MADASTAYIWRENSGQTEPPPVDRLMWSKFIAGDMAFVGTALNAAIFNTSEAEDKFRDGWVASYVII